MNMEILNQLKKTVEPDKLLTVYCTMSGKVITQEELDLALKPKKKASILTIEKELLSSYIEAVSDIKRIKEEVFDLEQTEGQSTGIMSMINEIITKHTEKIKSSGIWD